LICLICVAVVALIVLIAAFTSVRDAAISELSDVTVTSHGMAEEYCAEVFLTAGTHQFAVEFTNDFFALPESGLSKNGWYCSLA